MLLCFLKKFRYFLFLFFIVLIYTLQQAYLTNWKKSAHNEPYVLYVEPGCSWLNVIHSLNSDVVYKNAFFLMLNVTLRGQWYALKVGEYEILPNEQWQDVVTKLVSGTEKNYTLTIYPSSNWHQLRKQIASLPLSNIDDYSSFTVPSIEGYFKTDSYYFTRGYSLPRLLSQARRAFMKDLSDVWMTRDESLNITQDALVVIASLIEREALDDQDRAKIARVIYNRLNINMPLQIDASMVYVALGEEKTFTHLWLKREHPFNTYLNRGLPPSPIAYVSYASMYAAAHPDKGDWLYYRLHCNGKHRFSYHFNEHRNGGSSCRY